MKQPLKILVLIIATIFWQSCNESSPKETPNNNLDFIKTFEGRIDGKYAIVAKIQSNSGKITGSYFYKKVRQILQLKGKIDGKGNLQMDEFDEKGKRTGLFKGLLVSPSKLEGIWVKPGEDKELPFYLIESNSNFETDLNPLKKEATQIIKILFRQEEYDDEIKSNISKLKVNTNFLEMAGDGIRAITGYYSTVAGTDCWWKDDNPNQDYSNLVCKLTEALNLGSQCSESHKSFIKRWFAKESEILKDISNCYNTPYTATSQSTFDYLTFEITGQEVIAKYQTSGVNLRTESSWSSKGEDQFKILDNHIKVIQRKREDI